MIGVRLLEGVLTTILQDHAEATLDKLNDTRPMNMFPVRRSLAIVVQCNVTAIVWLHFVCR